MSRLDDLVLLNKLKHTAQNLKGVNNISLIDDLSLYDHALIKLKEFNAINILEKYEFTPFERHDFIEFFDKIINPADFYILPLSHLYMAKCQIISPQNFLQSWIKINSTIELEIFNDKIFMAIIEDETKNILFYVDTIQALGNPYDSSNLR